MVGPPALIDAENVAAALPWTEVIPVLEQAFRSGVAAPPRLRHELRGAPDADAVLLTMPAWNGRFGGVKLVTVFPSNARDGRGMVAAAYALFCNRTGEFVAFLDGEELTLRRTAGVAALAASYLARREASRLLVIGTGKLAARLPHAYSTVRPIAHITIWGRRPAAAAAMAAQLRREGLPAQPAVDLAHAVANADIIVTATGATSPLFEGRWLGPGTHVDLLGSFRPHMAECDVETLRRATLFAETRTGVLQEAGEFVQAVAAGAIPADPFAADLHELAAGHDLGRRDADEITLFKSVGNAIEDLACAASAFEGFRRAE